MGKPSFVKFEVPKAVTDKVYQAVELASTSGKIRRGVNETTKAIERSIAKLVVIAEDVTPEEILMHLPVVCNEKRVPFVYVPSKMDLGKASGIGVPTSSLAIVEEGEAKKVIADLAATLKTLNK